MLTPRGSLAAVALNDRIYAVGGFIGPYPSGHLATMEEYDPTQDTWTARAPMVRKRQSLGAVTIAGKIYVVGGNDADIAAYVGIPEEYTALPVAETPTPTPLPTPTPIPQPGPPIAVGGIAGLLITDTGGRPSDGGEGGGATYVAAFASAGGAALIACGWYFCWRRRRDAPWGDYGEGESGR